MSRYSLYIKPQQGLFTMPLFVWEHSEYLKNYGRGQIIVQARNPKQARKLVWAGFEDNLRERFEWLFGHFQNEDDREQIEEYRQRLAKDLEAEPVVRKVIFVQGSD